MSILAEVIRVLTSSEIEHLKEKIDPDKAIGRLLLECVNESFIERKALQKKLKISPAMLNKLESQALDVVYDSIKHEQPNSYDDIILVRQLLYRGLVKQAKRLAIQLEKIYLAAPRYAALDALYHEAIRVAYQAGDESWLAELVRKATVNADIHAVYSRLDKQLILNMLRVEQKKVTKKEEEHFLNEMLQLEEEVERLPHPVLKVNTLYILHLFYINRYDLPSAAGIIRRLDAYIRMNDKLLEDRYVHVIALSIVFYFYCRFDTGEEPGNNRKKRIGSLIGLGGPLELTEYYFNLFQYCFFMGRTEEMNKVHRLMQDIREDTRFSILHHVAQGFLHFARNDLRGFRESFGRFYKCNYMEFREAEINLRFMEVLLLLKEKDMFEAESRIESLRKFIGRSVAFYPEEMQVLKLLKKLMRTGCVEKDRPVLYYRSMKYFLQYMQGNSIPCY